MPTHQLIETSPDRGSLPGRLCYVDKAKYYIQMKIWNFMMEASENDRNIRKDDTPPHCSVEEL